ncbi:MAG: hypothetical protein ACXWFG_06835 [Methylobacter sp.]
MPTAACNLKIQRLEIVQDQHAKKINVLFNKQAATDKALRDIRDIKYILIGGFCFYMLDKVGLVETVMKFLG